MTNLKMFDRYENQSFCQPEISPAEIPDLATGSTRATLLKTIVGRTIGVSAKVGGALSLYFTLNSEDKALLSLIMTTATFGFEILDRKHNVILSAPVKILANANQVGVDLFTERNGLLCYGNYYMHLYILWNGIYYTLFDENDGVLSLE